MSSPQGADTGFRPRLGLFDFTMLVTGAIIGDGIYVVAAMGASSLGPAQLVAWVVAAVFAGFIALAFIQCAAIDPEVGGSYSYARVAFGPLVGFLAGWTLYVGEWVALSAFPGAFFNYFRALFDAPQSLALPVKLALIAAVTGINILGVREGARTNDGLTIAKVLPLALLALLGLVFLALHWGEATSNLTPFAPIGWSGFGDALLPIFWAYAGFELAVLPAGEVRSPGKTLTRGLFIGVSIAGLLYLLTSLAVVVALPWQDVAASPHPLATAMRAISTSLDGPGSAAARFMSLGGLISIAGVFLVFTLGLARLSYTLAMDGFMPSGFAKLHSRYRTPYVGIVFQAGSAAVFSSLFELRVLLSTAVLFLSLCYLLTALSALRLLQTHREQALHVPALNLLMGVAAACSLFLAAQASRAQAATGAAVVLFGLAIYVLHMRHQPPPAHAPTRSFTDHSIHAWLHRSLRRGTDGDGS
ncbi:MAG TPA: APC family permease [Dehalococcoidia bacterium]|nr:APC family permease [Dehalococcoidia bacterium]